MKNTSITKDELNTLPKDAVVLLYLQMKESFDLLAAQNNTIQKQNEELIKQVEDLREKIAILTQHRFGKHSEKDIEGQLSFNFENEGIFNETEFLLEDGMPKEPEVEEVIVRRKKTKGKRAVNLQDVETEIENHEIPEEELNNKFKNGYHCLDDEIYKELQYIPSRFKVIEHHIKIYAGNRSEDGIVRAEAPKRLLPHSILTPELAASVFNAKFVNGVPYNRISEEFLRQDANIPRQDMAGWMIRLNEYYMGSVHTAMKKKILQSGYVHCDETPFVMPEHKKEYMWVFHSPGIDDTPPVYLYEYLGGRNGTVIQEYLKGYKGTLITDGYQPYHTLAKNSDEIHVAGCWAHARRKFAEIIKSADKKSPLTPAQQIAAEAVNRIDTMYHLDNKYKESSAEERLSNRKISIKPLVDAYFAWIKSCLEKVISSSTLVKALNYSENQEMYLRAFLDDPKIPLDNNDAERSIKTFCVGKHAWHIIDSTKGASASAMLYSLAETAKANRLKPYEYFCYLLHELMKYPYNDVPEEALEKLMPWSDEIPDKCRKRKTR